MGGLGGEGPGEKLLYQIDSAEVLWVPRPAQPDLDAFIVALEVIKRLGTFLPRPVCPQQRTRIGGHTGLSDYS